MFAKGSPVREAGGESDDLVMLILIGAAMVGFVLGAVFLFEPRRSTRYTELYFATHKIELSNYTGGLEFNTSERIVTGSLFGRELWIVGPDSDEEKLIVGEEPNRIRLKIYQTFRMGDTYLTFADATSTEALFHEYPREVFEFSDVRLRFFIANKRGQDHTYYWETHLGDRLMEEGEAQVEAGEVKSVISSFPVGTTNNEWSRILVTLDTGQNISFSFRTYD